MKVTVLDDLRRIESQLLAVRRSAQLALLRQRTSGHLLLLPLRGGGDNALDAPEALRQGSRDDDALVESLQERLRKDGARPPDKAYVKAALALARDHEQSFKPDKVWFQAWNVPNGGAQTRLKNYVQRIVGEQLLTAPPQVPLCHCQRRRRRRCHWHSHHLSHSKSTPKQSKLRL